MTLLQTPSTKLLLGIALTAGIATGVFVVCGTAFALVFQNDFYPGISVGDVRIGGLSFNEGSKLVRDRANLMLSKGLTVQVDGQESVIPLRITSPDDPDLSRDLLALNLDKALEDAYKFGRTGEATTRIYEIAKLADGELFQLTGIQTSGFSFEDELKTRFPESYKPAIEPSFKFENIDGAWGGSIVSGSGGRSFDIEKATAELFSSVQSLKLQPIKISVRDSSPTIADEQAVALLSTALYALKRAPYQLIFEPSRFESFKDIVDADELAGMLAPRLEKHSPALGLNEKMDAVLEKLSDQINTEPKNARFVMENNRVTEFASSVDGRALNTEASRATFIATLTSSNDTSSVSTDIQLVVDIKAPAIPTEKANQLGIKDILGVGTSSYKGSPANRIKNIRHGVSKLNGLLIAPDETFSLLAALRPFTIEDGYFPELVIKGDEIKPEVAGGLCQIGTTTFRSAMNSGLPIVERQNHSLVVSYYNDPSNGKPGTDATIYDPAPDFKFLNDTGHYILFEAQMDEEIKGLRYTLWGTADGRKGSYSPPTVQGWTPAGEKQITLTTTMEPGKTKCQSPHPGAVTSFVYTIENPDGTKTDRTFTGHYRALPEICLVGATQEEIDAKKAAESAPAEPPIAEPVTVE